MNYTFDSVDSIVSFLQELPIFPPKSEPATTPTSDYVTSTDDRPKAVEVKRAKNTKYSKTSSSQPQADGAVQILPKGRVR